MKLCYVLEKFPQLSETFILNQMKALINQGHEITVYANEIACNEHIDTDTEPMKSLVKNAKPRWKFYKLSSALLNLSPYRFKSSIERFLDLLSDKQLNSYDAVVAHFGSNAKRVVHSKKRGFLKTPLITIFHGYDVGVPYKENGLAEYQDLFEFGECFLTVNEHFKKMIINAGAPADKVHVHRMGIFCNEISYTPRDIAENKCIISVCRFVEKKGIEFAIMALADLKKRRPDIDWSYKIIGDGPRREEYKSLVKKEGLQDKVIFLGSQPHSFVQKELKEASIFLLPSVTAADGDVEGVPVALMEAMGSGLITVSSNHSGIPDLIDNKISGFLSDERDFSSLSQNLEWIFDNPPKCIQISETAAAKVAKRFNNELLYSEFSGYVDAMIKATEKSTN